MFLIGKAGAYGERGFILLAQSSCYKLIQLIMKPILIIFFLFAATIQIYSNNKHKPKLPVSEIETVAIDTSEFIDFWDNFRLAVLTYDTIALASMIEDEIIGDCFLQVPDLHERDDDWILFSNKKVTKFKLITLWDSLFTNSYVALIEKYNIEEDLHFEVKPSFANKSNFINPKDVYACSILLADRRYNSSICFNTDNTIAYSMGYSTGEYMIYSIGIKLLFRKKDNKPIKLFGIDCDAIIIAVSRSPVE